MVASETRDGQGAGDHDKPYLFGQPLAVDNWSRLHLTILRGEIKDTRAGKRGGHADGDMSFIIQTPGGVLIPTFEPPLPKSEDS